MSSFNTLTPKHLSDLVKVISQTQKTLMELSGQDFNSLSTVDNYQNNFLPSEHSELREAIAEVSSKWSEKCLGEEGVDTLAELFTPVLDGICDCISVYAGIQLLHHKRVVDMVWLEDSVFACSLLGMATVEDDQRSNGTKFKHVRALLPKLIEDCLVEVAKSNISKIGEDGKILLREGKWIKPSTFKEPKLTPIIVKFLTSCRSAMSVDSMVGLSNE